MVERDNMSTSNDSLTERVQASFKQLSAASVQLNTVSDELGKLIAELEAALKNLNLGIEVWVQIDLTNSEGGAYSRIDLGYAKHGAKWGITFRFFSGHGEVPISYTEKPFNEAPRDLRVRAIERIPDLLEKLSSAAEATTTEVKDKLGKVQQVVAAVSAAVPRK
jgi:prefoldin subunit 5